MLLWFVVVPHAMVVVVGWLVAFFCLTLCLGQYHCCSSLDQWQYRENTSTSLRYMSGPKNAFARKLIGSIPQHELQEVIWPTPFCLATPA